MDFLFSLFRKLSIVIVCLASVGADDLSARSSDFLRHGANPAKSEACLVTPPGNISVSYVPEDYRNGAIRSGVVHFFSPEAKAWPFFTLAAGANYNHCRSGFVIFRRGWRPIYSDASNNPNKINTPAYLKNNSWRAPSIVESIINRNAGTTRQEEQWQVGIDYFKLNLADKNIWPLNMPRTSLRHICADLSSARGVNGGDCSGAAVLGGFVSGIGGFAGIVDGKRQPKDSDNTNNYLDFVDIYRIFGSFRHAPLFAQVSLIMGLGVLTFGLGPVGVGRLWPIRGDRRRLGSGLLYSFAGLIGFGLLCGLIFLS